MNTFSRFLVLSLASIGTSGQTHAAAFNGENGFCDRLGQQIGVKTEELEDGSTGWTINALNFGQRFLFGGTAVTSLNVQVVEPATVEDYKRLEEMCAAEGKGAVCRLVGPVLFEFGWKGERMLTPVLPGESAVVRVWGTRASCRQNAAVLSS